MIRKVTVKEVEKVADLRIEFYEELKKTGWYDKKVFTQNWECFLHSGDGVIFGYFIKEKLVGVLGVTIVNDLNNGDCVGMHHFWFVSNSYRRKGIGGKLLTECLSWVKKRGVKRFFVGHINNENGKTAKKHFEKSGFEVLQVTYMKEVS